MLKVPEFRVEPHGLSGFAICWEDPQQGRRYHFWMRGTAPEDVIFSNRIDDTDPKVYRSARQLDATAKKWAPVVAGMLAKIEAEGLLEAATYKVKADRDAKAAAERAARLASLRAQYVAILGFAVDDETIERLANVRA